MRMIEMMVEMIDVKKRGDGPQHGKRQPAHEDDRDS
jgi:hypothetical protein